MPDLLTAATWYARNGFRVFPLDGKLPHKRFLEPVWHPQKQQEVPSWKPLVERVPTPDDLQMWFGNQRANIGIATGISGYIVVDCDTIDEAKWWYRNRPQTSLMVKTGKGVHFYYRVSLDRTGNRAGINGRAIDLRGYGGYVVAAPSTHPDGGQYERVGDWDLAKVPEFDPAWVEPPASSHTTGRSITPSDDPEKNRQNARDYIGHVYAVEGQGGDKETYRAACILRDFGLVMGQALELLQEWNETNAVPPWTVDGLARKVQSAYSRR